MALMPNFFIIGAAKSGTSSLHAYLSRHPQILMSVPKETEYFLDMRVYQRGCEYYQRCFEGATAMTRAIGEASVNYMIDPAVAARIQADLPKSSHRFIAVLRNPIERAYSGYWNAVREGLVDEPFPASLAHEEDRISAMKSRNEKWWTVAQLRAGLYGRNLHPFLEAFGRDRVLVFAYEDMRNIDRLLREIFRFLQVDENVTVDTSTRLNVASQPHWPRLYHALFSEGIHTPILKSIVPPSMRRRVRTGMLMETSYPPMDDHTRRRLEAFYRDDILRLSDEIGRDFSGWLSP